jgi:TPR repeat protein
MFTHSNRLLVFYCVLMLSTLSFSQQSVIVQSQTLTGKQLYDKYVLLKDKEPLEAYRCLEKSAETGYLNAYNPLGEYYMHVGPLPIKENVTQSQKYFQKAKNAGMLQDDYGLTAALLFDRALKGQNLDSRECYQIAQMIQAGLFGFAKSEEKALLWFREASRKGNMGADFRISQIYKRFAEDALKRKDYDEVIRWADKFAEIYGSYEPLEDISEQLRKDAADIYPNDKRAFKRPLEYAARMGNAHALYNLGIQYCSGTYLPKNEAKGLALIKASDKLGYPDAAKAYNKLKTTFENVTAYNNRVLQEQQRRYNAQIVESITIGALLVATVAIISNGIKSLASQKGGGYSYRYSGSASVMTSEREAIDEDKMKAREMLNKCRPELTKCVKKEENFWEIELGTGLTYTVSYSRDSEKYRCNVLRRGLLSMAAYGLMDTFISDYIFDSLEEAKKGLLEAEKRYYKVVLD